MATIRRDRKRIPGDIEDAIVEKTVLGWSAAQIDDYLDSVDAFADRLPSKRTIQRMVKERRTTDTTGSWSLADAEPDQAKLVLEVLPTKVAETSGQSSRFTIGEADWLIRIRSAAPDLPMRIAWLLSRMYLSRQSKGDDTHDLDCFLSYQPWQSAEQLDRYLSVALRDWIPRPPTYLMSALLPKDADHTFEITDLEFAYWTQAGRVPREALPPDVDPSRDLKENDDDQAIE